MQNFVRKRKDVLSQFCKDANGKSVQSCDGCRPGWADTAASLPSARRNTEQPSVRNKACRQRPEHHTGENTQCLCGHRNHPVPTATVTMTTGLGTLLRTGKNHQHMQGCQPMANIPSHTLTQPVKDGAVQQCQPTVNTPSPHPDTQLVLPWDRYLCCPALHPQLRQPSPCIQQLSVDLSSSQCFSCS